ncbi:MAG: DNA/RNA non-specific endonuclease, partial [Clostridium sp.]
LSSADNFKENISKANKVKEEVDDLKQKEDIKKLDDGLDKSVEKVKYGNQYTKVNGKKVLKSNVEYVTEEGYKYVTDSNGRISTVEGSLNAGKAKRNTYAQRTVGKENGRLETDDGGHLIASIFKGSGDLDNLVPMDAILNRGDWKSMEKLWAKALDKGKTVDVKIESIYSRTSQRPISFEVKYKIGNGDWKIQSFSNSVGGS